MDHPTRERGQSHALAELETNAMHLRGCAETLSRLACYAAGHDKPEGDMLTSLSAWLGVLADRTLTATEMLIDSLGKPDEPASPACPTD
jgi:hypothetical protein